MKVLEVFFHRVTVFLRWICVALILGMSLTVIVSVFFRYVLNNPLVWSEEVIRMQLVAMTYFGAALAAYQRGHINVELLENWLGSFSPQVLKIYRLLMDLCVLGVLLVVIDQGVKIAFFSQDQQTDILLISYFWVYIIMPVSLIFMVIMLLRRIYEDWLAPAAPDDTGPVGQSAIFKGA